MVKPFFASTLLLSTRDLACPWQGKLNLAATLWNSFNSCPVRRSSSSLTPSGGSCHFAVPRNSLIWLASGPPTSSIPGLGQSQSFQVCGDRTWPEVAKLLGALAEVPLTRVFGSGKARQESRRRQTLESSRSDRQETARMASET